MAARDRAPEIAQEPKEIARLVNALQAAAGKSKGKEGDDTEQIYKSANQTHHLWTVYHRLA